MLRRKFIKTCLIGLGIVTASPMALLANQEIPKISNKTNSIDLISKNRTKEYIKTQIEKILSYYTYEYNDDVTRQLIVNQCTWFLETVRSRRGIFSYQIICDKSNNTSKIIDSNSLVLDLLFNHSINGDVITQTFIM